ncbi:sigma-70 family RNA polymerase sigma factor (plasmid) [Streptomyces sp. NBC_01426]|uniref:RNA polymerase sigma factor n=1 Tax=Streptomyces sp. NBC_01426 TaxID=2975866 RepID=UPI002E31BB7A|nr:sigma-70 family RNA polymerase sigma factor [Streptomyces sp. NBC_01426]
MSNRTDALPLTADTAARLDRLFRLYNQRLVRLARNLTNDPATAEDVVMDAWVRAGRSLHQLVSPDAEAFAWLAVLTRHAVADFYKVGRNREIPRDWADAVASFPLPAAPAAEDIVLAEPEPELSERLAAAVATLPEQDQAVLLLRADGMPYAAVAGHVGRGDSYVYAHFHRAVGQLRLALAG